MTDGGNRIIIIAGPNGAGKSTFALEYLPHEANCPLFVNADLIAAGLSPFAPEVAALRAGRLMLMQIADYVRQRKSFAIETTLAGRGYARMLPHWRASGYSLHLVFLKLDSVELALERVAGRVAQGGHNVPEPVVRRRFVQGWRNFNEVYRQLVDSWRVYDNSGEMPDLIEMGERYAADA